MTNEKRLIDANALLRDNEEYLCKPCKEKGHDYHEVACRACWVDDMRIAIEDAPTVDAVEVVHGKWEKDNPPKHYIFTGVDVIYRCSECNNRFVHNTHYCPNCGAKMDGDGND